MGNLVFDHIGSFISILITVLLSLFTYKDLIKEKPFTSFLLTCTTFGFIISTLISFNLNLGKFFIYIYYITTLGWFLIKIFKNPFSLYVFLKDKLFVIITIVAIGSFSTLHLLYNLNINFIFNAHDSYFYGIPFEIIEGNYSSRIKIWDNYPKVWSKYHFFNGSVSSIFLLFTGLKNIFLYKLLKMIFIIILIFSVEENLRNYRKLFYNSLLFTIPITIWFFSTNGDFPLAFLTIALLLYLDKKFVLSLLFLLFFSSSLARHVIPGILIFLFIFSFHYKDILKSRISFLFLFPIINIISMLLLGSNTHKFDINHYLKGHFLEDFFYSGWTQDLFQNLPSSLFSKVYNSGRFLEINDLTLSLLFYLISSFYLLILIFKLKNQKIKVLAILVSLSTFLLLIFKTSSLYYLNASLVFIFPVFIFIFLRKKLFNNPVLLYSGIILYITTMATIVLFGSAVGIPNFYLCNLFIVFILLKDSNIKFYDYKINWIFAFLICGVIFPKLDDSATHLFDMKKINIENPKHELLYYKNKYDTINTILFSNIFGKRIKFFNNSSTRFHMTNNFICIENP